jgi:hypothetical protein
LSGAPWRMHQASATNITTVFVMNPDDDPGLVSTQTPTQKFCLSSQIGSPIGLPLLTWNFVLAVSVCTMFVFNRKAHHRGDTLSPPICANFRE